MDKHHKHCSCDPHKASADKDQERQSKKECGCESEKIKDQSKEQLDYKDKFLRTVADLENTRKRLEREKQESVRFASERIVKDILPVLDSFEHALKALKNHNSEPSAISGLELIMDQLMGVLKKEGLVRVECIGKPFDHQYHEAVGQVEREDVSDGEVVEEVQSGYMLHGRAIRLALVKVARSSSQKSENDTHPQ